MLFALWIEKLFAWIYYYVLRRKFGGHDISSVAKTTEDIYYAPRFCRRMWWLLRRWNDGVHTPWIWNLYKQKDVGLKNKKLESAKIVIIHTEDYNVVYILVKNMLFFGFSFNFCVLASLEAEVNKCWKCLTKVKLFMILLTSCRKHE